MLFQDFAKSLYSELQLPKKPLPRQKPTAETFSDTPLPGKRLQTPKDEIAFTARPKIQSLCTPKFLGMTEAYFVYHIDPIFRYLCQR